MAAQLAQLAIEEESDSTGATSDPQVTRDNVIVQHRLKWERGEIDYTGVDSFDNIMGKILNTLGSQPKP